MKPLPAYRKRSAEAVADLCARARVGDVAARNALITANMRLVARIATRHARAARRPDLLDDCIQEAVTGANGRGGLMRAIELFDPTRHRAFSTFAAFWIRDAVTALLKGQHITATKNVVARRARIRTAADRASARLGRPATSDEVRAELIATGCRHESSLRLETIEAALGTTLIEVSLSSSLHGYGSEEDKPRHDWGHGLTLALADPELPDEAALAERIDGERRAETLRAAMGQLAPDARAALERRFGFGRNPARERTPVTKAEAAAMRQLRELLTGAQAQ